MMFNSRKSFALAAVIIGSLAGTAIFTGCDTTDDYDDDSYYRNSTYPYDDPREGYDDNLNEGNMRPGGAGTSGREGIDTTPDEPRDTVAPDGNVGGVGSGDSGTSDPS